MNRCSKLVSCLLAIQITMLHSVAFAKNNVFLLTKEKREFTLKGNEFVSGDNFQDPMMRVSLIGAINRPGVHLLPEDTKLTTALSYAGGMNDNANIEKIILKRKKFEDHEIVHVNFDEFMKDPKKQDIILHPDDIVHVPSQKQFISNRTLRAFTVVSMILGIVVSSVIISDNI